eukprot:COSAG01_NODE_4468_length_4998_cov_52.401715_5_plen_80_part_00
MFVTWSQWNEDAHDDASYDVSKALELYDGLFRVSRGPDEHEDHATTWTLLAELQQAPVLCVQGVVLFVRLCQCLVGYSE